MVPTRRALLRALASSGVLVAGCVGSGGDESPPATAGETPTSTSASSPESTAIPVSTRSPTPAPSPTTTATSTPLPQPSSTAASTPTATPSPEADVTVTLRNRRFSPVRASVDVGATVRWVNEDTFTHDVTATTFHDTAASWSLQVDLPAGASTTYTFDSDGVYEYYCTIHGEDTMCGVIVVGNVVFNADLPCHEVDSSY